MISSNQAAGQLIRLFREAVALAQHPAPHRPAQIWADWLELAACAVHQIPYRAAVLDWDQEADDIEHRYIKVAEPYSPQQHRLFGQMLGVTKAAMTLPQGDLLGWVATDLDLEKEHQAQSFTPGDISALVNRLLIPNIKDALADGPLVINEDCVGSGSMVIALLKRLHEAGFNYRAWVQIVGVDLDRDACNMAYIQLGLLGAQALIQQGDVLTQQTQETKPTPQLRLFWQWAEKQDLGKTRRLLQLCCDALKLELESVATERGAALPQDSHHQSKGGEGQAETQVQKQAYGRRTKRRAVDELAQLSLF